MINSLISYDDAEMLCSLECYIGCQRRRRLFDSVSKDSFQCFRIPALFIMHIYCVDDQQAYTCRVHMTISVLGRYT